MRDGSYNFFLACADGRIVWPYCRAAKDMVNTIITDTGALDIFKWRRRLETLETGGIAMAQRVAGDGFGAW